MKAQQRDGVTQGESIGVRGEECEAWMSAHAYSSGAASGLQDGWRGPPGHGYATQLCFTAMPPAAECAMLYYACFSTSPPFLAGEGRTVDGEFAGE